MWQRGVWGLRWVSGTGVKCAAHGAGTVPNYFSLFPATFAKGMPDMGFTLDTKALRKEYRKLQAVHHPDRAGGGDGTVAAAAEAAAAPLTSALINKAYETLHDPLKRAQYIIATHSGEDLNNDEIGKRYQFQDKEMLLEMMDIHERMEEIMDQRELNAMKKENEAKIKALVNDLSSAFAHQDWDKATFKTVRLKYCYNIKEALKNWAPGEPVTLTH